MILFLLIFYFIFLMKKKFSKKLIHKYIFHPFTVNFAGSLLVKLGLEGNDAFEAIVEIKLIISVPKVIIKKK